MNDLTPNIANADFHTFVLKAFRELHPGKRLKKQDTYIRHLTENLENFLDGDIKKLLINLPGRHLKSILCCIFLPAFALGNDPSLQISIVGYKKEIAEDCVRLLLILMESDFYKATFETRLNKDHRRKRDFAVTGGGRVRAVPVNGVTGIGGDIVIFDDPHNAHDWDDDRAKMKVIDAFELLVSRRNAGRHSRMLVVGHRVAEDDLSAHIIERKDFDHICLPLFAPHDMSFDVDDETWVLHKGEALQSDVFTPDEIDNIRKNHRTPPFRYYWQQGLGPNRDDFSIGVEHFPFVRGGPAGRQLPPDAAVVLSVDPAQRTNSTSRNVIHVYAVRGAKYEFVHAMRKNARLPSC